MSCNLSRGSTNVTITITSDVNSLIHRQLRGGGVTITITSNVNSLMHRQRRWGGGGAQKVARYQMIGIFVEFFPILQHSNQWRIEWPIVQLFVGKMCCSFLNRSSSFTFQRPALCTNLLFYVHYYSNAAIERLNPNFGTDDCFIYTENTMCSVTVSAQNYVSVNKFRNIEERLSLSFQIILLLTMMI